MTEDFYFDTSIWIDVYEKRGKNGENGFKLIEKIIEENKKVGYSNHNINEFKALRYSQDEINGILKPVKPNYFKKILYDKMQVLEAKKLSIQRKVSRSDALHAILARDYDFDSLKDVAKAKLPEDFVKD